MEPRARAGKNAGKTNFSNNDLSQLLYSHGDVRHPVPDTVRVLDEILTDFVQSVSFEAARAGRNAGRQKLKFEDFEFALRKNDQFLGKVQEVFEKKADIDSAKRILGTDELMEAREAAGTMGEKERGGRGGAGARIVSRAGLKKQRLVKEEPDEDEDDLGLLDDDDAPATSK